MKYRNVAAVEKGGPKVLQIQEHDLREPSSGEYRIKVLAVPVCLPDVQARYGMTPYAPRFPFVPGYAIIGDVDAIGAGIQDTRISIGDRVAALTVRGGYAEYLYLKKDQLIPAPLALNPAEMAVLILNYIVAYQVLHRSARVKAGDTVLIIGASGGIGTAFLQLGQLAGLKMYGLASASKHARLAEYEAKLIDYHRPDCMEILREAEPDGFDAVFDGMVGDYVEKGLSLLGKGGTYVQYGNPLSLRGMINLITRTILFNLFSSGKKAKIYGTSFSIFGRRPFLEDWSALFKLLAERKIKPVIEHRYPLLEAAAANARLESGQVTGNLVLLSPELL